MYNQSNNQKSILVTGANGGLGIETVKFLVNDGFGRIVMATRTEAKALAAREEVLASTQPIQDVNVEVAFGFDMTNPAKIEAAVNALPANQLFDIVFLQAGGAVFTDGYQAVEYNGRKVERTIFQNAMGGHITLFHLKRRNLLAPNAKVIIAGGEGARGIPGMIEKPFYNSPEAFRSYVLADFDKQKPYNPMNAIGVSKFASALWTKKIAEIEAGNMEIIWFTPGLTYGTAGLSGMSPVKKWFMANIGFGIARAFGLAQSPKDGARKYADAIEGKYGINGDILGSPEGKTLGKIVDQTTMNENLSDQGIIDEYWAILEELFGVYHSEKTGMRASNN